LAFPLKEGGVAIWDVEANRSQTTLATGTLSGICVAFDPTGGLLATAGLAVREAQRLYYYGEVAVWDLRSGNRIGVLNTRLESGLGAVAFSPQGSRLAVATDQGVRVWDVSTGRTLRVLRGHLPYGLAFSRDGRLLASGGKPLDTSLAAGPGHPYLLLWSVED
jgi:WD40 repeat protein